MNKKMLCKIEEAPKLIEKLTSIVESQPKEYYHLQNEIVFNEDLALIRIERALTSIRDEPKAYIMEKHTIKGLAYLHTMYGLSEEEIVAFKNKIDEEEMDINIFLYNDKKVKEILDLFYNIGVRNICAIINRAPYMFYDPVSSIRRKIDAYEDKEELARKLNEDPENLELIHLA